MGRVAVTAAAVAHVVVMAVRSVLFLFVAAAGDGVDVPGVRWNPGVRQGD